MEKIILDLCGGTGSWSKPYREDGYDVRIITLPDFDVTTYEPPENVHGILAAPPCTEFSKAKNGSKRQRNLSEGMETVRACMNIIWQCRQQGSLKFWALENPVGLLRQFLGVPKYSFYQWQFGTPQSKHTDLFGYFNPPKPTVKTIPPELQNAQLSVNARRWGYTPCPEEYRHLHLSRAAIRAITPPGFAQAFRRANP
jgi:site-specific DNA-cytosine methylase